MKRWRLLELVYVMKDAVLNSGRAPSAGPKLQRPRNVCRNQKYHVRVISVKLNEMK